MTTSTTRGCTATTCRCPTTRLPQRRIAVANTKHGHVSFDVRWRGSEHDRKRIRDKTFGFAGEYVPTKGHIDFRVSDDDSRVVYTSQPHGQTTVSGGIGHERNGVFFA
jgi:hypothetical protein